MTNLQQALDLAWERFGTLDKLSKASGISKRTIEEWISGRRKPRSWCVNGIIKEIYDLHPKESPKNVQKKK